MNILHLSREEIQEELAIIKRAQKKPDAFGILYERYHEAIFLFINRRVDDLELSADLVSQVFLKAMLNLSKYKFQGVPFSAWLFRIAANHTNEHFRKSKQQRTVSFDQEQAIQLMDEIDSPDEDHTNLLIALINQLNEEEIEILELRFFEQKPFKEVAYILNITENNAKVKVYRIIEKMKKKASVLLNKREDF